MKRHTSIKMGASAGIESLPLQRHTATAINEMRPWMSLLDPFFGKSV